MNRKETVVKMFWHDSDETNLKASEGKTGKFDLLLGSLLVGTLVYSSGVWTFCYSEEFKKQDKAAPLINFPLKEKVYESNQLHIPVYTRSPIPVIPVHSVGNLLYLRQS